jgi:predicted permease
VSGASVRRTSALLAREMAWAVRRLARRPLAAAVAVLTVAVALAPSLIFQLVGRAVLPPLPFERPAEVISVWQHVPWRMATSYPKLRYLAEHSRTMDVAAIHQLSLVLEREGPALPLAGAAVTPNLFRALGTKPLLGRVFRDDENTRLLDEPIVVLSERAWREDFGARPGVLAQKIRLGGRVFQVVGVMPRAFQMLWFQGSRARVDFWIPAVMVQLGLQGEWRERPLAVESSSACIWVGIGRLRRGHELSEARAEAEVLGDQVRRRWPWPEVDGASGSRPFVVSRLSEDAVDPKVLHAVSLLRVAGGLVLVLGGLNLASLFFARGLERSRALGLHAALGAPRFALVGGVLVEAVVVGVLGGLGAIVLARGALTLLGLAEPSLLTAPFGATFDPAGWRLDAPLIVGAVAVSAAVAVAFSLAPALRTTRVGAAGFVRGGPGITAGGLRRLDLTRPGGLLVTFEMAVALALITPALLLVRSLEGLVTADLGFRPPGVLTAPLRLPNSRYSEDAGTLFVAQARREVARIPGVEAASWTSCLPIECGFFTSAVNPAGSPKGGLLASVHVVAPGAFDVLGIPVRRGRDFGADDRPNAPPAVILSERGARLLGVTAPGARIDVAATGTSGAEVVGIVGDVPYGDLAGEPLPAVYFTLAQRPQTEGVLIARSSSPGTRQLAGPFERAVESLDPHLERLAVSTLAERVGRSVARFRGAAWLLGAAAVLALLLSGVGVYGVLSSLVARSVPEIGIRMTLGASPGAIGRSIAGATLGLAAAGTAVGAALGTYGATYLRSYLYGVRPGDAVTLFLTLSTAAALAMAAALAPARRASRVDPMVVLRCE